MMISNANNNVKPTKNNYISPELKPGKLNM